MCDTSAAAMLDPMMQRGIAVAGSVALAGCQRVPSINLLGAFFPSWMACILLGIGLTLVAQRLLAAGGIESSIGPRALIYPALALGFTLGAWLAFFRG